MRLKDCIFLLENALEVVQYHFVAGAALMSYRGLLPICHLIFPDLLTLPQLLVQCIYTA